MTCLIPKLLKMVDDQRIALTPAVELSYLPAEEQRKLADEIEYADATPSLSQAQRLRRFSEEGRLSVDTIFAVLSEEKPQISNRGYTQIFSEELFQQGYAENNHKTA